MVQNVTGLHSATLFEVYFSDTECTTDAAGVTIGEDGKLMLVGGEAVAALCRWCDDTPVVASRSRDTSHQVMCEYMQSMSHSDLKFKRLSDYEGDARAYGAQKSSEVKDFDCRSLLGMYEGVFGPHGLEVIHIATDSAGRFLGMKVTGDPNVPAGELCFRTTGEFQVADPSCNCQYGCGCWQPEHDPNRGWDLVGMFKIQAQTAMHGFQSPQWNPGRLLVCQRKQRKPVDCYMSKDAFELDRFLILVWDGLFSTRLAPLQL
jgi:hypothetical protein